MVAFEAWAARTNLGQHASKTIKSRFIFLFFPLTHLDDRETENRSSDIANQHTGKSRYHHRGQKNYSRRSSRLTENKGREVFINPALGKRGSESETTEQEHNDGCPHGREDVLGRRFGIEPLLGHHFRMCYTKHDAEERDDERGNE